MTADSRTKALVVNAFEELTRRDRSSGDSALGLPVEPIGKSRTWFAGVDSNSNPVLVAVSPSADRSPPVRLKNLTAEFARHCVLVDSVETRLNVRAALITCLGEGPSVRGLFYTFVAELIQACSDDPSSKSVAAELDKWLDLFWRLEVAPGRDTTGLVGELALIYGSEDRDKWVMAWHSNPRSVVDFVFDQDRVEVEVKATTASVRRHHMTLGQTSVPDRYVASVLVEKRVSGVSLLEITQEILSSISQAELRVRFWRVLTETCGYALEAVLSEEVSLESTLSSVSFYRAADIPQPVVLMPLPPGVERVSFWSDLTLVSPAQSVHLPGYTG